MRFPLTITDLRGGIAVVAGGGVVGERKVRSLLAAGVPVRLISPTATEQLQAWADGNKIVWEQRTFRKQDLDGAGLVFAATNLRAVNRQIAHAACDRGLLVNVADAPAEGNFHSPAVHRTGDLIVSVSTISGRPRQATSVRDKIAALLARDS